MNVTTRRNPNADPKRSANSLRAIATIEQEGVLMKMFGLSRPEALEVVHHIKQNYQPA